MCRSIGLMLVLITSFTLAVELDPADEAEVHRIGSIQIIDPWAKASVGGAHEAKLFFEFRNGGEKTDKLIDVRSPIASGLTNFRVVLVNDGERKATTINGIEIPVAEKSFELTEVGYYIELTGLELPVLMGSRFPVELKFERAGRITVEFVARFHSPKLTRRIREAAARGDIETLKALRPTP
jgi:copper(I)-binding protein